MIAIRKHGPEMCCMGLSGLAERVRFVRPINVNGFLCSSIGRRAFAWGSAKQKEVVVCGPERCLGVVVFPRTHMKDY
jgi:hypothetical protein